MSDWETPWTDINTNITSASAKLEMQMAMERYHRAKAEFRRLVNGGMSEAEARQFLFNSYGKRAVSELPCDMNLIDAILELKP
jgi:hypothetical protein